MPLWGEDDIAQDRILVSIGGSRIDEKVLRKKGMEVKEGPAVIWGFWEGFPLDFEDGVQI